MCDFNKNIFKKKIWLSKNTTIDLSISSKKLLNRDNTRMFETTIETTVSSKQQPIASTTPFHCGTKDHRHRL